MLPSSLMSARGPRVRSWTRRALISALLGFPAAIGSQKRRVWPAARYRYLDPATEFALERLTDPAYASLLPPPQARAIAQKGGFLLVCSDRSGLFQLYRLDERTGEAQQLTEATALNPRAYTLLPGDENCCYLDGAQLRRLNLRNLKERLLYRVPHGWRVEGGLIPSPDGKEIAFVETDGSRWVLRLLGTAGGRTLTVLETSRAIGSPTPGPRRREIHYLCEDALWICGRGGRPNLRVASPPGRVLQAYWSRDGRSVIYLHQPAEKSRLVTIREYQLAKRSDQLLAETSQFACFSFNSNESVFVGASANVASPHVLLLLRATRRELTLCEHRAADPATVWPVFSADSRRLYFQSDRDGKPAVYRMLVERLIEPTDTAVMVREAPAAGRV